MQQPKALEKMSDLSIPKGKGGEEESEAEEAAEAEAANEEKQVPEKLKIIYDQSAQKENREEHAQEEAQRQDNISPMNSSSVAGNDDKILYSYSYIGQEGGGGGERISQTNSSVKMLNESLRVVDHFSLGAPSSSIRFRNKRIILYGLNNDDQIILETDEIPANNGKGDTSTAPKERTLTVKKYHTATTGLRILRMAYTLVNLLVLGFLVAFCFQIIVFLFLNMASNGGNGSEHTIRRGHLLAVIASAPLHLYALASILAMGGTVVQDTAKGNPLFQQLLGLSNKVIMESICVFFFLLVPGTTLAITLLSSSEFWWETTAWVWVVSVFTFMVGFSFLVFVNEVWACLELIRQKHPNATTIETIRLAILTTQTIFYSGVTQRQYLMIDGKEDKKQLLQTRTGIYSKLSVSGYFGFFEKLDPPVRLYTADEIRDVSPFFTAYNWSLERMFCRNQNKTTVFIHSGPSALREGQVTCSFVFAIIAGTMICLIVAGTLVWNDYSPAFIGLFSLAIFMCCVLPILGSARRLHKIYQESKPVSSRDIGNEEGGDDTIFQVWERYQISEPSPLFCWSMFLIVVFVGFLWPFISFLAKGETTTATLFFFLGVFSLIRLHLNPVPLLRQAGSLSKLPITVPQRASQNPFSSLSSLSFLLDFPDATEEERIIKHKAKLSALVGKINNRGAVKGWMCFFGFLMVMVGLFALAAFDEASSGSFDYKVKVGSEPFFAHDFYYPPQPKLSYPTCRIYKEFSLFEPDGDTYLMDVAYMAALGFAGPDEAGELLDEWFGKGEVIDNYEFVADYRKAVGRESGVSFKLFSFPRNPGVGLVSIRGSEYLLDWAVDVQLWLGAAVAQLIRSILPLGGIWNSILDDLVYIVNSIESDNLKQVAYYTTTTKFINDVLAGDYGNYTSLRVTGASLGGGLAIITGAQTNTTTVSISGLNSMLSRRTYNPPVSAEALNTHILNIIPDRDPIARIDDPGRLIQRLECRAPANSLMGCHSMWRAVCEFSYQCGTRNRPILCWCIHKYGYPVPIQNGTKTFEEVCPAPV